MKPHDVARRLVKKALPAAYRAGAASGGAFQHFGIFLLSVIVPLLARSRQPPAGRRSQPEQLFVAESQGVLDGSRHGAQQ